MNCSAFHTNFVEIRLNQFKIYTTILCYETREENSSSKLNLYHNHLVVICLKYTYQAWTEDNICSSTVEGKVYRT